MNEPKEPTCPPDRKPHSKRVKEIADFLPVGKTGGICIDNTTEHKEWYLYELAKYPRLAVVFQGDLTAEIYVIKVRKVPSTERIGR